MTSCDKTLYRSYKKAENVRRAQEHKTGEALRIYWCDAERGFHLTHKPLDPTRGASPSRSPSE